MSKRENNNDVVTQTNNNAGSPAELRGRGALRLLQRHAAAGEEGGGAHAR